MSNVIGNLLVILEFSNQLLVVDWLTIFSPTLIISIQPTQNYVNAG